MAIESMGISIIISCCLHGSRGSLDRHIYRYDRVRHDDLAQLSGDAYPDPCRDPWDFLVAFQAAAMVASAPVASLTSSW